MYFLVYRLQEIIVLIEWDNIRNIKCGNVYALYINNCIANEKSAQRAIEYCVQQYSFWNNLITIDIFISKQSNLNSQQFPNLHILHVPTNDFPIKINYGQFIETDLGCTGLIWMTSYARILYPCVLLLSVSSCLDRSRQTKPLTIRYSVISHDNGWSIPLYPDLPAGVNFHKRIQISRPRRNLTIPEWAAAWWNFRFRVLNSRASRSPLLPALLSDRSRRVPYFYTIDLDRFDVGFCIIQRFLLSSRAFVLIVHTLDVKHTGWYSCLNLGQTRHPFDYLHHQHGINYFSKLHLLSGRFFHG